MAGCNFTELPKEIQSSLLEAKEDKVAQRKILEDLLQQAQNARKAVVARLGREPKKITAKSYKGPSIHSNLSKEPDLSDTETTEVDPYAAIRQQANELTTTENADLYISEREKNKALSAVAQFNQASVRLADHEAKSYRLTKEEQIKEKQALRNSRKQISDFYKKLKQRQLNRTYRGSLEAIKDADIFVETIKTLLNTTPANENQKNNRDKLVADLMSKAKGQQDFTDLTAEALDRAADYYISYGDKTNPGSNSEAIYLLDKLGYAFYENLRQSNSEYKDNSPNPVLVDSAEQALVSRKSKPRSLLSILPSAAEYLRSPDLLNKILPKDFKLTYAVREGIDKFLAYKDEAKDIINNKILSSLTEDSPTSLFYFTAQRLSTAPLHYLRDPNTGQLPDNVVTAVLAELQSWMGTRARDTLFNSDEDIARILNLNNVTDLTQAAKDALRDKGTLRSFLIRDVGSAVLKHLNLQVSKDLTEDSYFGEKLSDSLGMLALETGFKMGFFEPVKTLTSKEFNALKRGATEKEESEYLVHFIKAKGTEKELQAEVGDFVNNWADMAPILKRVFDITERDRKPLTKEEQEQGLANQVERRIKKTLTNVDNTTAENLKKIQNQPSEITQSFQELYQSFDRNDFRDNILGWRDPETVHITQVDSQKGKNRVIEKDMDVLEEVYQEIDSSGQRNPVFFRYSVKSNFRAMIDSNRLNPTSSKQLHRIAIHQSQWKQTIPAKDLQDLNNGIISEPIQDVLASMAFALGLKGPDKQGIDKTVEDAALWEHLLNKLKTDSLLRPAIDTLKLRPEGDKNFRFTSEQAAVIGAAVSDAGEKAWSLDALDNWARLEKAQEANQSFTHVMPMEVDGLTNGIAIMLLQLPATRNLNHLWNMLGRVGIFNKEQASAGITSFAQLLRRYPDVLDHYQDMARRVHTAVSNLVKGDFEILGQSYADTKRETIPYPILQQFAVGLEALRARDPDKVVDPAFGDVYVDDNNNVTKYGRNSFKDVVMTSATYAAGKNSVLNLIGTNNQYGTTPVQLFYKNLMAIAENPNVDNTTKAEAIRAQIQLTVDAVRPIKSDLFRSDQLIAFNNTYSYTGKDIVPSIAEIEKDPLNYAKTYVLDSRVVEALQARTKKVYGLPTWNSISEADFFEPFVKARDKMLGAMKVIALIQENLYNKRLKAFIQENNRAPTPSENREILQQLVREGYGANFRQMNSTSADQSDYIEFASAKDVVMTDWHKANQDGLQSTAKSQLYIKEKEEGTTALDTKDPTKRSMSMDAVREMPDAASIGVAGFVRVNQSQDAGVINQIHSKYAGYNIFDAHIHGTGESKQVTQGMNEIFLDSNLNYSYYDAVTEKLESVLKKVEESSEITPDELTEITDNAIFKSNEGKEREAVREEFEDFDGWFKNGLKATQELITENRAYLKDNIGAVNQFSRDSAAHLPGAQERLLQALEVDLGLQSGPEAPQWQEHFKERYNSLLGADTARTILEDISKLEQTEISPEHDAQLNNIMDMVILPGLGQLDQFKFDLAVNPDGTLNKGVFDGESIYIEAAGNELTSPINLSLKETYVHELVHAVTSSFIENDYWARNEAQKLFDKALANVTWQDFLPEHSDGQNTEYEIEKAKERYDYLFNNPNRNQLHEFVSLGLTNQQLAKALSKISDNVNEELSTAVANVWKGDIIKNLWNILTKALAWISGKIHNPRNKNVQESLLSLAKKLTTINTQERSKLAQRIDDQYYKLNEKANTLTKDVSAKLGKAFLTEAYRQRVAAINKKDKTRHTEVRDYEEAAGSIKAMYEEAKVKFPAFLEETSEKMGIAKKLKEFGIETKPDILNNVLLEIKGLSKDDSFWRNLKRLGLRKIDTARKQISEAVQTQVEQLFDRELSKDEWITINEVFLRGDISSLIGSYSAKEMLGFLTDSNTLNAEIRNIQDTLRSDYGSNGMAYLNQAKGLGKLLATGIPNAAIRNQMQNAHEIANLYFQSPEDRKTQGDLDNAEQLIDRLASLHYLQYADPAYKSRASDILEKELDRGDANGITRFLELHNAFKDYALETNFEGNKIGFRKGYTKEQFDTNVSIKVNATDEITQARMKKEGYILMKTLPRDAMHEKMLFREDKHPVGMYVSKLGLQRYEGQIVSLVNPQHRGTSLMENAYNSSDYTFPRIEAERQIKKITELSYQQASKQFKEDLNTNQPDEIILVPILSPKDGSIVDYRYLMSEENKVNILGREDLANETMGRMFGSVESKVATKEVNREVLKASAELWANTPEPTKTLKRVGPGSADPKDREVWKLLPEDLRREARKEFGEDVIYIKPELQNYILGFRRINAVEKGLAFYDKLNAKYKLNLSDPPVAVVTGLAFADRAWRELTNIVRAQQSVLNPAVVLDNAMSNVWLLLADGISPLYILKNMGEGFHAIRKYRTLDEERVQLENQIRSEQLQNRDTKALETRLNNVQRAMEKNPAKDMIQEGLFQAITEQFYQDSRGTITEAATKLASKVVKPESLEKAKEKIKDNEKLDSIVSFGKEAMMLPGSRLFGAAVALNQYTDAVSRYIKYKHDTEVKKIEKEEAINRALDDFIFYDEPSDPWLTAANDYGLIMFSKFYLRIQRVIAKLFSERPATVIGTHVLDQLTTDVSVTPYSVFLDPGKALNRISTPLDVLGDHKWVPSIDWARAVIPGI